MRSAKPADTSGGGRLSEEDKLEILEAQKATKVHALLRCTVQ